MRPVISEEESPVFLCAQLSEAQQRLSCLVQLVDLGFVVPREVMVHLAQQILVTQGPLLQWVQEFYVRFI